MVVFDFNAFETDFREACLEGIRLLARRYNAASFYAVSVYVDGFDGDFGLYANTEDVFRRTLEKYRTSIRRNTPKGLMSRPSGTVAEIGRTRASGIRTTSWVAYGQEWKHGRRKSTISLITRTR